MIAITIAVISIALLIGSVRTIFQLVGRGIGAQIRSKTTQRRELFFERARNDARLLHEQQLKKDSSASDDDWEQIDSSEASNIKHIHNNDNDYVGVIGFFHPFCNAGGGGERVLFAAILATQQRYPRALCVVYTGDVDATKETILKNAQTRFNIHIKAPRVAFVYLSTREWVLASTWPHFTLLGQSIGSLILAWDAFTLIPPDIFIDTMGYAYTLALSKWLFPKVPTAAYVHYPTISMDMLNSLNDKSGTRGLNAGAGEGVKGKLKQIYWNLFAKVYGWIGGSVDVVMTNSSWTYGHINSLWAQARQQRKKKYDISILYPPCAVKELEDEIPAASDGKRTRDLLYIAQFRPEKMHHVIIDAFHNFLKKHQTLAETEPRPRLMLLGSVRDDADEKRVYKLRLQAQAIRDSVQFIVNAKWPQILDLLKSSSVGVNGMWNEHFGIGVVEYQAAGLISVVNNSGGPKEDIVVEIDGKPTGFHASTTEEFTEAFAKALSLTTDEQISMRNRARKSALRFSEDVFTTAWSSHLQHLIELTSNKTT